MFPNEVSPISFCCDSRRGDLVVGQPKKACSFRIRTPPSQQVNHEVQRVLRAFQGGMKIGRLPCGLRGGSPVTLHEMPF